jgi:hypothetical protein
MLAEIPFEAIAPSFTSGVAGRLGALRDPSVDVGLGTVCFDGIARW